MPFATHPGGFLKRELKARELGSRSISAYRPVASRTYSMDAGQSLLIQPSGSVDILEIVPNSGLICRVNTTLLSLSASAVLRLRAVCDQRMRCEVQYLSGR
jgi:hypothetical protein